MPNSKSRKRLFLIDGAALCYRAFYAIRDLRTSKGVPTNAIYGVIVMLRKLIEETNPDYLAFAFDLPKPTFRHEQFEDYKVDREPMPDDLGDQMPRIREVIEAFRIPIFEEEGFEADDVMGTLALQAAKKDLDVFLVTSDKDVMQVLGPRVCMFKPTKEGYTIFDTQALDEKWGIEPHQVIDVLALMGDAVDGVPGVPGVGEKTAISLVQNYGSVEGVVKAVEALAASDEKPKPKSAIRPSVVRNIQENLDQLEMSRELVTLDTEVPVQLKLPEIVLQEPDNDALYALFEEFEFRTLLKQLKSPVQTIALKAKPLDDAGVSAAMKAIRKAGQVAVALPSMTFEQAGTFTPIGLSWTTGQAVWVDDPGVLQSLGAIWEDANVVKVCPNLKETELFFARQGQALSAPFQDPVLASYLCDPTRPAHDVASLSVEFLGQQLPELTLDEAQAYLAHAALQLMPQLNEDLADRKMEDLMAYVELPLAEVLSKLELEGIAVDLDAFEAMHKTLQDALETLTKEIHALAEEDFNINSSKQLAEILFEKLGLPVIKKTKTGASTNEEVLHKLEDAHPLPGKILEYRELAKLNSTYVEALPKLVSQETGKIHASFHQTVTATGRLSASNPNLQNIPIRTALGRQVRQGFVPASSGQVFLAADYSQIELRILAHMAEDKHLIDAFAQGRDIHRATAAQVFDIEEDQVDDSQRAMAKTINFGIVYGMTAFGLSKQLDIFPGEAQTFIDQYFAQYPSVRTYLDKSLASAKKRGFASTLFYRRRYLPELTAKSAPVRQFAERTAINAPIQGTAADLVKIAMVNIDALLEEQGLSAKMVLQVHDELVFDVPEAEVEPVRELVQEAMETPQLCGKPIRLKVPLAVNVEVGKNWLEASHG